MISRRRFNAWATVAVASGGLLASAAPVRTASHVVGGPRLTRDGIYTEPWFLDSFLEIKDDLDEAHDKGKNFAIIWELDGCPYCRETHLVNFAQPKIRDYVKDNFDMLQLDVRGARETTDFDGKVMNERALAKRHKVRFSPTVQFFAEDTKGGKGEIIEVARMAGYFRPLHFLTMFEYVRNKGYVGGNYRSYLKAKLKALKSGKS